MVMSFPSKREQRRADVESQSVRLIGSFRRREAGGADP